MIETLWDFCPGQKRQWWPSTAQIGTKILYFPGPDPVVYVVPLSNILGWLSTASCASWIYWDYPLLHEEQEGSML